MNALYGYLLAIKQLWVFARLVNMLLIFSNKTFDNNKKIWVWYKIGVTVDWALLL